MVDLSCLAIKRNKFCFRYSIIHQAQYLDDAHGYIGEHHIALDSFECLYYTLLLVCVLYLGEGIIRTFPAMIVQPGDCTCPKMIEEPSGLLFHLTEHGFYLKTVCVSCYDIFCWHGQVCIYKNGCVCL